MDNFTGLTIVSFELALYFFIIQWRFEIITALSMLRVGLYVLWALILLVITFGTYQSIIIYKLPYRDKTIYTIKIGFK